MVEHFWETHIDHEFLFEPFPHLHVHLHVQCYIYMSIFTTVDSVRGVGDHEEETVSSAVAWENAGRFFTSCSQASSADSRDWKFHTGSQLHVFTKTDLSCTVAADRIQENATAHEMRTVCPSSLILYTSEVHVICLGWNASTSSCCLNQTISTSCMWNLHFSRGSKKKKRVMK